MEKRKKYLIFITFLRISLSFIILINPLWGYVLWAILDIADCQILVHILDMDRASYNIWDKNVDLFTYLVMLAASSYSVFFPLLLFFLIFRTLGQIIFEITKKRIYLILFPNYFEVLFVFFIIGRQLNITQNLTVFTIWIISSLLLLYKTVHEIIMHYIGINKFLPWFALLACRIIPGYQLKD